MKFVEIHPSRTKYFVSYNLVNLIVFYKNAKQSHTESEVEFTELWEMLCSADSLQLWIVLRNCT